MRRALLSLLLISPLLRGAGCTAHYGARLKGEVRLQQPQPGAPILVKYRVFKPNECVQDWPRCLRAHDTWLPMRVCEGSDGRSPGNFQITGAPDQQALSFEVCTGMVGVNYSAYVMAFVDLDQDGQLDDSEPYGLYEKNPLTRETEPKERPLSITLDQRLDQGLDQGKEATPASPP